MNIDFDNEITNEKYTNYSIEDIYNIVFKQKNTQILTLFSDECIAKNRINKYIEFANYAYKRLTKERNYYSKSKIISCMMTFTLNNKNRELIKKMDEHSRTIFISNWKNNICQISKSKVCIEFHIVMELHKDGIPHFHCAVKSTKYPKNFAHRLLLKLKNCYGNYDISVTVTNDGIEGAIKYMSKYNKTERVK